MRLPPILLVIAVAAAAGFGANAAEFKLEEVASLGATPPRELKPRTILFVDQSKDKLADATTGLIPFEDWVRARPVQQRFLSLFPGFVEPVLKGGAKLKLSIYVAEARFRLAKPANAFDLSRYATIAFLENIDPAIKHRPLAPADAWPNRDMPNRTAELAHSRRPDRAWCVDGTTCIESRYKFEGKIPSGILLANKLRDENKKPIPDFIEFQSEMRLYSPQQPAFAEVSGLTGIDGTPSGVLEQSIFWVNQVMQFGKLLAVLQPHPDDANASIASVYLVLAVRDDVLNKQRDFAKAPILRNLVPAQLLMGKSSFNAGNSISAGLPKYARSRIQAIAAIMDGQ
jgi:hypothetical protein